MLKVLLIIIVVAFIVGALILMVAVNYVMSIFRRFRQGNNGEDDNCEESFRRHSSQYSFRGTSYSPNTGGQRRAQRTSSSTQPEIIVDTRDPSKVNRQIISDDEGEYVDFIEEK